MMVFGTFSSNFYPIFLGKMLNEKEEKENNFPRWSPLERQARPPYLV